MENTNGYQPISREQKEQKMKQRGCVIWMTGLSGAGKSTLAMAAEQALWEQGKLVQILDGDVLRAGLNRNLGFSEADRLENIRRTAETAKLLVQNGIIVICSLISPLTSMRSMAADIIGATDFQEVYVSAPLSTCEARDVKGLYQKARAGLITDFTGISAPYEAPEKMALTLDSATKSIETLTAELTHFILQKTS